VVETLKVNYKRLIEQNTALKMNAKRFAEDLLNSEQELHRLINKRAQTMEKMWDKQD
jgi:regulator of replication initiation timing